MSEEGVSVNEADENKEASPVQEMPQSSSPPVSAGAQLAALRELREWTIEQVASQLNLAGRQIHALETDHYAALPGMVIVRGFIRSYAKLLRTDPAPILAAIVGEQAAPEVLLQDRGSLSTTFSETKMPSAGSWSGASRAWLIGLLFIVVAVVASGIAAQRMGWLAHKPAVMTHVAAPQPVSAKPPHDAASEAAGKTFDVKLPVSPPAETTVSPEQPVPAVPAAAEKAADAAPVAAPAQAAPDGRNALVFQVKEDTWVEIRRADDTIQVSRLFKAGSTEVFDIAGPVSVVVGNAAGVSMTLRGKPVDISGNSSNVARLNLK